jgi:hypothetical protein
MHLPLRSSKLRRQANTPYRLPVPHTPHARGTALSIIERAQLLIRNRHAIEWVVLGLLSGLQVQLGLG